MNLERYLNRINFQDEPTLTIDTLTKLHQCHVLNVPFENLSIHFGDKISLVPEDLFRKVVEEGRGGYCYELNYLFHCLLLQIGYSSTLVSSRIYNTNGTLGPDYDHLSIVVNLDSRFWLLDVGYGDLFFKPIEIEREVIQSDERNYFKIEMNGVSDYILLMSQNAIEFEKRYSFSLAPCKIQDFNDLNRYKSSHPDSYFVKNVVCTKPTTTGRVTLFNNKLIVKNGITKHELAIENSTEFQRILREHFAIDSSGKLTYPFLTR